MDDLLSLDPAPAVGVPPHPMTHPQLDPALQAALWHALTDTLARARVQAIAAPPVPTPLPGAAFAALTTREREVLARIASGDSNKLIARALGLSLHTVKRHVANILDKLDARSRSQAAVWWLACRA